MSWAVVGPTGEGVYWPDGGYDRWKERAQAYYDNEMSDAEKIRLGQEDKLSFYEMSRKYTANLGWLDAFECPDEYGTFSKVKNLASMINTNNRLFLVDEALKEVIDRLELGKHQFWPIKITMPKGVEYPKRYYGMVVHTHLDAFLPERSDPDCFRIGKVSHSPRSTTKAGFAGLAMSLDVIGDSHIWQESKFGENPRFFLSDRLKDEIDRAGLKIPKHLQLTDV